jgi:DNA-binding CsgD family transcriptional regulator
VIVRPVLCRPFIGRLQELAYLRERRLEAARSHGGLVLVAGDAGVGKSRLISEFCKSLAYSRWKLGHGACLEFASRPYGPMLEALSRLDAQPLELGAADTKREQFDAIVDRFAAIAARTALIVVVEDLHWADAATLDLLSYLGTKLHRMRVLVVASVRTDELHPGHLATSGTAKIARSARAGRIELRPLKGSELQSFVDEALAGIELPEEVRRAAVIAGDGNPFYTEELLKSAVEQNDARSDARNRAHLPQTVRAVLLERLRPFDQSERRIVTQAAVIGRTFGLDLLAATLESDPKSVLPALRRARDFQLVEEIKPKLFRFRHGLTRDALYSEFLGAELQPRHRAIGIALEGASPSEQSLEALAYHWWAAKEPAKAAHYNELAGDAAARVYAHEDAIAFYERALESDLNLPARGGIVRRIADCRNALGSSKEAQAAYSSAADAYRAAGARELEASCRVTAAITAYIIGLPNPIRSLESMLAELDESEYLARSRIHLGIAWLAATFAFPTRALRHLEQIDRRALTEAADIGLRYHNVAAFAAMEMGDLETFRREHAQWVAAAEATGSISTVAIAYVNGAMCRSFFALHDEARQDLARALALTRQARSHSEEAVHAFGAMCALLRGDLAAARAELEHVSPTSENRVNITFATAFGSVVGAALDDRALIERWFDRFEATIAPAPEVECGGGFGEIMVRRGRDADAAALLHRALPDCEILRGNIITLLAVGRYGAPEDRERARKYLERAAAGEMELPERPALALFDAITSSRNGRTEESIRLAREAADGFRRLGFPLFEAQAREAAGDVDAALALFRRCGAAYDVRRLEGDREEVSSKTNARASTLSTREREIAMLAASGRSNLEIARSLSITHKTVEKHLGSVYQKLQISSRAQLDAHVGTQHQHGGGAPADCGAAEGQRFQ